MTAGRGFCRGDGTFTTKGTKNTKFIMREAADRHGDLDVRWSGLSWDCHGCCAASQWQLSCLTAHRQRHHERSEAILMSDGTADPEIARIVDAFSP